MKMLSFSILHRRYTIAVLILLLLFSPFTRTTAQDKTSPHSFKPSIISLSPASTELIYALGLENYLIAVDQNSNYPQQVKQLPSVGDPFYPNTELLAAYHPNWIISFSHSSVLDNLQSDIGFQQWIMQPQTMEELLDQAQQLSTLLLTETPSKHQTLAANITRKIQDWRTLWNHIQQQYNRQSPYTFLVFLDGSPMYTVGPNTFLSRGLQACGLRSAFEQQPQPAFIVSPEALLLHTPDYIIAGIDPNESSSERKASIITTLAQKGLRIKATHIILADRDTLFRPSVRFLEYLPTLCQQIHQSLQ